LQELQLGDRYDINVLEIRREEKLPLAPASDRQIQVGDVLVVHGASHNILAASEAHGLDASPEWKFDDPEAATSEGAHAIVEVTAREPTPS
jgi:uncharacterized protein with PhoU and TrkA domain